MLTPLPMRRVMLHVLREDAPAAALALAESEIFNPVPSQEERLPERPAARYQELFHSARMRLRKVQEYFGFSGDFHPAEAQVVSEEALAELNEWLGQLWHRCSRLQEKKRQIAEKVRVVAQLDKALDNYAQLDVNLGLLQGGLQFLDIRIGAVPESNLTRLQEAVGIAGYILKQFARADSAALIVLAGMKGNERQIQSVLRAADYRPLPLPPEFQDHPEKVRQQLAERRHELQEAHDRLARETEALYQAHEKRLLKGMQMLTLATPYALLADSLHGRGGLATVQGWAPAVEMASLQRTLQGRLGKRFVLESRPPTFAEQPTVPSLVRTPRWLQPFTDLVHNYGIPRYGELDPSWLFALTFIAMFGMMFGDVGHGATIIAVGMGYRRQLGKYASFVLSLGISSYIFGFLYGSVFGYEEVIPPLWMAPMSNPQQMLIAALFWGVGFILLTSAITIRNCLMEGRYREALLGGRGLAGTFLYLGFIYGVFRWAEGEALGLMEAAAILLPLGVVLGYQWHETRAPRLERGLVVFIESFEIFMGYIANTLSFLRIAAFSLNHAALALSVFALAGTMEAAGHWVIVVAGNIFILILEGAIVAIQALRLEYYEGFSRFFRGDGRAFQPLILSASPLG